MAVTLKANNIIINSYFEDYKGCVIEMEKEDVPLMRSKDNFDPPKGGGKKVYFYVRLKGYQTIFNTDIYKSENINDCVKYVEEFFKLLASNTTVPGDKFLNLDELIKI